MRSHLKMWIPVTAVLFLPVAGAQVQDTIRAHVDHSFMIGDTTLPAGDYTFRNVQKEDHEVMTATDTNDRSHAVDFIVRPTIADHTPRHSELVFHRYGNTEFLAKIFEGGSRNGMEVTETGKQEAQYAKQQRASEHTEEQKQ